MRIEPCKYCALVFIFQYFVQREMTISQSWCAILFWRQVVSKYYHELCLLGQLIRRHIVFENKPQLPHWCPLTGLDYFIKFDKFPNFPNLLKSKIYKFWIFEKINTRSSGPAKPKNLDQYFADRRFAFKLTREMTKSEDDYKSATTDDAEKRLSKKVWLRQTCCCWHQ